MCEQHARDITAILAGRKRANIRDGKEIILDD